MKIKKYVIVTALIFSAVTMVTAQSSQSSKVKCSSCTSCSKKKPSPITITWTAQPAEPVVVQKVVTQYVPVVVEQPVVVQQPVYIDRPVVYDTTPRTVYYNTPLLSLSAYAGVSTYGGGYYTGTYWQENSRHQEYRNIAQTRYNFGLSNHRSSYGGNYSHNYRGGNEYRGSSRSSFPATYRLPTINRAGPIPPPPRSGSGYRR